MRKIITVLASVTLIAATVPFVAISSASAADLPTPASSVCSLDTGDKTYACMEVQDQKVPSGATVMFTGSLSTKAQNNLKKWTKGDNIVCLTRYKTKPEADGSWPWQTLEGACTTVRKNGQFTINAEFGRKGSYYYGLEMGPCRGSKGLCGNGDSGLIGVYDENEKALLVKTT